MATSQKRLYGFIKGLGFALAGSAGVYFVGSTVQETLLLQNCQGKVLSLALKHEQLVDELGGDLFTGPLYASRIGWSPTGREAQCQFRLEGTEKRSTVTASVRTIPGTSFITSLTDPNSWELVHCHVLTGIAPPPLLVIIHPISYCQHGAIHGQWWVLSSQAASALVAFDLRDLLLS
jgi:hypothetical protein